MKLWSFCLRLPCRVCVCVCVYFWCLLSLEILELGAKAARLFWLLLLPQLLHFCLQGSQLLLQSLRDTSCLQNDCSKWDDAPRRTRGASFECICIFAPSQQRVHAPRLPSLWLSSWTAPPADPLLLTSVWHIALESCSERGLQWNSRLVFSHSLMSQRTFQQIHPLIGNEKNEL